MDKARKAFVVLAAAVTAGNAGGCGSDSTSSEDAKNLDAAAAVDSKATPDAASTPDTKREEVAADAGERDAGATDASQRDAGAADASLRDEGAADVTPPDAGLDGSLADPADTRAGEVMGIDGGTKDTGKLDGAIDALGADVLLRLDASVTPDGPAPLVMPAGTAYDVFTRQDLA